MCKIMQGLLFVTLLACTVPAQAGVTIDVAVATNSDGNNVFTLTAISDGAAITSVGINVVPSVGSTLGQVHPSGFETPLGDYNPFFGATPLDHDTQALFATAADNLLVVSGTVDTAQELNVNFTGFVPFTSRAVVQYVVIGQGAVCTIGTVADGVEYTNVPPLTPLPDPDPPTPPEPASLALIVVGSIALLRRQKNDLKI